MSSWRVLATGAVGLIVLLSGCRPVSAAESYPSVDASRTISASAAAAAYDPSGLDERIVHAAQSVQSGTFALAVSTSLAGGSLTMRYQGSYDVSDPAAGRCRLDGTQNGQLLTMIVVGDDLYTKVGSAKYAKSSVSASAATLGLASIRPDLPTLVDLIGTSAVDLLYVGSDTIDGVPVQHWRASVTASSISPGASGTTPVEVWIDADYLVHQISYSSTGAAGVTTVATVTYTTFNEPVEILEPTAAEIR